MSREESIPTFTELVFKQLCELPETEQEHEFLSALPPLSNGRVLNPVPSVLREELSEAPKGFQAVHINCKSLPSHIDEFRELFGDVKPHCILVSETWLKPTLASQLIALKGYSTLRNDRTLKGAGGVCIYLRNDVIGKIICQSPSEYLI